MVGYPEYAGGSIYNAARVIRGGRGARASPQGLSAELPGVRREALFHAPAPSRRVVEFERLRGSGCWCARTSGSPSRRAGARAPGPRRCWSSMPRRTRSTSSASASSVLGERVARGAAAGRCIVNLLGGQDELVFDGNSFVHGCARRAGDAGAGVQGGAVSASSSSGRGERAGAAARAHRARALG